MNICIYAASSDRPDRVFFTAAEALGRSIAEGGHCLIFGGGRGGLMGACARGAYEAGGKITGIAPEFFDEPGILYKECGEFIFTKDMRGRKKLMQEKADGFILLPGGIGSFEEFFETLTLKQLGRLSAPITILNTENYYAPMLSMLQHTADKGFMSQSCTGLYRVAESPEEAVKMLLVPEEAKGSIHRLSDYSR